MVIAYSSTPTWSSASRVAEHRRPWVWTRRSPQIVARAGDPQAVEDLDCCGGDGGVSSAWVNVHEAEELLLRCRGEEVFLLGQYFGRDPGSAVAWGLHDGCRKWGGGNEGGGRDMTTPWGPGRG